MNKNVGLALQLIVITCFVLLLSACSSRTAPAPVSSLSTEQKRTTKHIIIQGDKYRVQQGDTLYAIAFSANKDVREIAKLNRIAPPYTIHPNQLIYLESQWLKKQRRKKPTRTAKTPTKSKQKNNKKFKKPIAKDKQPAYGQKNTKRKRVAKTPKPKPAVTPMAQKVKKRVVKSNKIHWQWPTKGKIKQQFSTRENGYKGLQIANKRGTSVQAAANGIVVYAGDALRGYGRLIIVKHNDDFLSAYAHNSKLFVVEKQKVKAGQKIAEIGSTEAKINALRFEIRYRGKAVNPQKYLPKRRNN